MWMYGPYQDGVGWMGGFMMLHGLLALLLIAIVVAVVVAVARAFGPSRPSGLPPPASRSRGLEVLDERYAKGEIPREEYLQKRRDLEA